MVNFAHYFELKACRTFMFYDPCQCFPTLLVCGTLNKFCRYLVAPLGGEIGIHIKELYLLTVPLAPAHGTLQSVPLPLHDWESAALSHMPKTLA